MLTARQNYSIGGATYFCTNLADLQREIRKLETAIGAMWLSSSFRIQQVRF